MDPEDFRKHAHAFVDWMANYLESVERYPVRAQVRPGDIDRQLSAAPPEAAEPMAAIFRDFETVIVPGITHWQHPSFFAYFPANSSPPSVLAEMLTATLGAQGMIWETSPAATELETRVMDWLRQMIGLPDGFAGVIQDTASSATLCAMLSARERVTEGRANEEGLSDTGALVVYCSQEAHSSVEKDVKIAGLGRRNLHKIAVGKDLAMDPAALERAIVADRAASRTPTMVVATLGTTGAGGFDPLAAVGEICRQHGVWLHVDAAWAGSALLLAEERWMLDGIEHVDSFVFNPHKWLFTNFDCSAYFVRDPGALVDTFHIQPAYLKTRHGGRVIDYRDWGIPLGRRFRALKLWFVIRSFGVDGLRERIRAHIALARKLAAEIAAVPDFEVVAPARLAMFCFRYRPAGMAEGEALDGLNQRLVDRLNDSGALYLTSTQLKGGTVIRFQVGQTTTERRHVAAAWAAIQKTARALAA